MRFVLPELRERMRQGLEEIRSGKFAQEWAAEQAAGYPTLRMLREAARAQPIYHWEQALRQAMGYAPPPAADLLTMGVEGPPQRAASSRLRRAIERLRGMLPRRAHRPEGARAERSLQAAEVEAVWRSFLARAVSDATLRAFAEGQDLTVHYVLEQPDLEFYMRFADGEVRAEFGSPPRPAHVRLRARADVLDGVFTGRIHAVRAVMSGRMRFEGEARVAMGLQAVQDRLSHLYCQAREEVIGGAA